jgi:hypothetical protein
MGLFDIFRRPAPIGDLPALADFIDRNAAFLVQKGMYEYSRARAGHYAKVLFAETGFQQAIERSRWRAYPLGLAMVTELVEGVLRPHVGDRRQAALEELIALVLSTFDRYPVPSVLDEAEWREARIELERRLGIIGIHAVKHAKDIPAAFADGYFALMPIDKRLRGSEFPTIHNYLRVTLINMHEEFSTRVNAAAVAAMLSAARA